MGDGKNDPKTAIKKYSIPYENANCIFLGAHTGGDKGDTFMKPFLRFWEETLLGVNKAHEKTKGKQGKTIGELNQRPLPCEGRALLTNSPKTL